MITVMIISGTIMILSTIFFIIDIFYTKPIIYTATAGAVKYFNSQEIKMQKQINVIIKGNQYSSSDKKYWFMHVNGSSMEQFNENITDNSLVIVDSSIKESELIEQDPILLLIIKNNKKCYKLRSFISFDESSKKLSSKTYTSGNIKISNHIIDEKEHFYIGKVIAEDKEYFINN